MNVFTCSAAEVTSTPKRIGSHYPVASRISSTCARSAVESIRHFGWVACLSAWLFLASLICSPVKGQTVAATVTTGSGPIAVAVNPRTNKIYVADFYDTPGGITVIDGKTNTTKSLTTITGQTAIAVNPLTNMIYSVDAFNNLTVVDGSTDTVAATVTVGMDPVAVAVNPATNTIYVANQVGSSLSVIDGTSNKVTATLGLAGGPNFLQGFIPSSVFVNPVTNQIYVTCQSADMQVDGKTNTVTQLSYNGGLANGGQMGVNPVTNTVYAVEGGDSTVLVIDETSIPPVLKATVSSNIVAPVGVGLNPVTNKVYVLNGIIDYVTAIDGASYVTTSLTDPAASGPTAVTVNPTTNQMFVANSKSNNVTVIDGTTYSSTLTVGTDPVAIAANPVTNMVYVANFSSNNVTVIAGTGTVQTIPLTTTITPFTGNQTPSATPTFTFSAASTFAPVAPPVEAVYFQVDSLQGTWTKATSTGGANFSGTATLQNGSHTLYAFATDGQDATSTVTGVQSSPLIGSVASYTFTVAGSGPVFTPSPSPLAFGNQTVDTTSSAKTLTVTNSGTTDLTITTVTEGGTNKADFLVGTDTCSAATVNAGKTCTVSVEFAPTTTSSETASLSFADNAPGSPHVVNFTGTGVAPVATASTTALSASATSIAVGASVTFTATVSPASGTPTPTGTVTFKDGATTLGTGTLNSSGVATYATGSLAKGAHAITASYGGDTRNLASVSTSLAVTVTSVASTTALTSSAASAVVGSSLTFTATVKGGTGAAAPTGAVTFKDGSTTLGTGAVNASGVATYTTTTLAAGSHSITASYAGDTNNAASVSSSVAATIWPGPADFTMELTPGSGSFKAGKPATVTITVTSVNGFNAAAALTCGNLPKNTVCTFSSSSITPDVSGTATSTLTITTDKKPAAAVTQAALEGHAPLRDPFLSAGAALALFLFPLFGARNRKLRRMLMALSCLGILAIVISTGIAGCGGGPTTPKGSYSIQITGAAGSTSHSATYALTVQ